MRQNIEKAVAQGLSQARAAKRYSISTDSLFRHLKYEHITNDQLREQARSGVNSHSAIVMRMQAIADACQEARLKLTMDGDLKTAERMAHQERLALNDLVNRLGITSADTSASLQEHQLMLNVVTRFLFENREQVEPFTEMIRRYGQPKMADSMKTYVERSLEEADKNKKTTKGAKK